MARVSSVVAKGDGGTYPARAVAATPLIVRVIRPRTTLRAEPDVRPVEALVSATGGSGCVLEHRPVWRHARVKAGPATGTAGPADAVVSMRARGATGGAVDAPREP